MTGEAARTETRALATIASVLRTDLVFDMYGLLPCGVYTLWDVTDADFDHFADRPLMNVPPAISDGRRNTRRPAMRHAINAPKLAALTVAAAALASIAGNAMAQENQDYARDLTAEQTAIYTTRAPATRQPNAPGVPKGLDGLRGATMMLLLRSQTDQPTALSVAAWVDHPDGTYAVGEQVRLFILTSRDAYVTVIKVGASGRTTVLFPNRFQTDNLVRGNTVMEVPDPSSNAKITVAEAVGAELIKVIASTERVTLFDATQLVQAGAFTTVRATPSRVARDLQVTMASWSYVQWDDYNKVILTVAENHAAAAGAPAIGEFPSQPFALQVATDKQLYRVGDAGSATRNLSVVANSPDDETAIETIGFVVVQ